MGFDEGRDETIRYHEELYSAPEAHDPDAWLNRPAPIVMDALAHLDRTRPVRVYDLGAGSGRHAIPLARALPAGSRVVAVDLLDIPIQQLKERAAHESVGDVVIPVVADQETYEFDRGPADLVLGVSTLEHVSSRDAFVALLERMRDATAPGGVHVLGLARPCRRRRRFGRHGRRATPERPGRAGPGPRRRVRDPRAGVCRVAGARELVAADLGRRGPRRPGLRPGVPQRPTRPAATGRLTRAPTRCHPSRTPPRGIPHGGIQLIPS